MRAKIKAGWGKFKSFLLRASLAVVLGLSIIFFFTNYRLDVVVGNSMFPTIDDGQIILVQKDPTDLNVGDIVVTRPLTIHATDRSMIRARLCKRVIGVSFFAVILEGDNKANSWMGPCFAWEVSGRVVHVFNKKAPSWYSGGRINNYDYSEPNPTIEINMDAGDGRGVLLLGTQDRG